MKTKTNKLHFYSERDECERCHRYFYAEDVDFSDGKILCRDCEREIYEMND
jgi:formylmethanofuran dehydrogenase subunit E